MINNNIEYTDIPGYEGIYMISKYGGVLSLERKVYAGNNSYRTEKSKILKQLKSGAKGTHLQVQLALNGRKKSYGIHVLVAMTFIPNILNLPIVEHIDDNPHNNYYTNLKWSTNSKNIQGAYDRGRKFSRHENINNTKINE